LRVARMLKIEQYQETSLEAAIQRIGRHAIGIKALSAPLAAGVTMVDGDRRLTCVHSEEPLPSAQERIASGVAMSLDDVLVHLDPIAEALGALHDQGIVHGSVHPAAIRLTPTATTLSAFGLGELALVLGGPRAARDVVPARSRTPEQVGVVPASPSTESDTYALAMIAVELLAGRALTHATDSQEIAAVIDHPEQRPTPPSLGIKVPAAVEKVFTQALRPNPRDRMQDPRRFLAELSASRWKTEDSQRQAPSPTPLPLKEPVDTDAKAEGPTHDDEHSSLPNPLHSGAGFDLPPRPESNPKRSNFYPPPPPEPSKSKSTAWLVYALVGMGVLLLIGGVGVAFFFINSSPAAIPSVSATTAMPPPSPTTVPVPSPPNKAHAIDDGISADGGLTRQWDSAEAGTAFYPNDATALIPVDGSAMVLGSRDALVTIVLFTDMKCPYARPARLAVERLLNHYDRELRVVVRHLPLSEHSGAELSAEIAAGAGALAGPQAFWQLFTAMTDNPALQTKEKMLDWASNAGVSRSKLESDLNAKTFQNIVQNDKQLAG
ncbi:MAG: hypothetical protein CSA75_04550, partial [Sorangium cellulosum]